MIVKMHNFRNLLHDHKDFVLGMSFVSINNTFEQS